MPERAGEIETFLAANGWADASKTPIAGDMSSRRYFRLHHNRQTAILMDADEPMGSFVSMTDWLSGIGLSVPEIRAAESDLGLVLLEDFGDVSLKAALIARPEIEDGVFGDCVELLLRIRHSKAPALPCPTPEELVEWTTLTDDHYPSVASNGLVAFRRVLTGLLAEALQAEPTVSLRDFHTENMMWLPERDRYRRLGLLDYQDAFLTHPVYDLMSLLTDARTRIPRSLRDRVTAKYLARSGDAPDAFGRAFAAFSAQRNLRILGIFARAGRNLSYLPNTYGYFEEALEHPAFENVRAETLQALPAPNEMT